jgi:hypothetical protein
MGQMKMFKMFNQKNTKTFNNLFGENNIVCFDRSNIVGVRYDYEHNRLKNIMSFIPFAETQQFMITPEHFVSIYSNIKYNGLRPTLQLNVDLPLEECQEFESILENFKLSNFKEKLVEKLIELEEEFNAYPEKISFFYNNHRVTLYSNGIFFGEDDSLEFTDEVLNTNYSENRQA